MQAGSPSGWRRIHGANETDPSMDEFHVCGLGSSGGVFLRSGRTVFGSATTLGVAPLAVGYTKRPMSGQQGKPNITKVTLPLDVESFLKLGSQKNNVERVLTQKT